MYRTKCSPPLREAVKASLNSLIYYFINIFDYNIVYDF